VEILIKCLEVCVVGASSTCVDKCGPSIHGCHCSVTVNGHHGLEDPSLEMTLSRLAALNITFSHTLLKCIKKLIVLSSNLLLLVLVIIVESKESYCLG
jgi:hypothetical protein